MKIFESIQNMSSEGFEMGLVLVKDGIDDVFGIQGNINVRGLLNPVQKKHIKGLKNRKRLTSPLLKSSNGKYLTISFNKAFDIIKEKLCGVEPDENLFLVSSYLTNEELYSIQKIARGGVGTNNVSSLNYFGNEKVFETICRGNVILSELEGADIICVVGRGVFEKNPMVAECIRLTKSENGNKVVLLSTGVGENDFDSNVFDQAFEIENSFLFFSCLNKYIVDNNKFDLFYVSDLIEGFDKFKTRVNNSLLNYNINVDSIREFANIIVDNLRVIFVFNETSVDIEVVNEIFNLVLCTGKLGKSNSGIMVLRDGCNSEGVFNMGTVPYLTPGCGLIDESSVGLMNQLWGTNKVCAKVNDVTTLLENGKIRNLFVFGNDGPDIKKAVDFKDKVNFMVLQTPFEDEDFMNGDLIMPASLHFETGGTFTNSFNNIQQFKSVIRQPALFSNLGQYSNILNSLGLDHPQCYNDVFFETVSFLKKKCFKRKFDGFLF